MPDQVQVANMALQEVGASSIISLDDATPEARAVKIRFDQCRQYILRCHPWNFASDRKTLAALTSTPTFGYLYQHQLPADFVRLRSVNELYEEDYKLEGRMILSNAQSLEIIYTKDVVDMALWDAGAIEALVLYLAWKISFRLQQSSTLTEDLGRQFQIVAAKARFDDATEEPADILWAEDYLESRQGLYNRGFVRDPMT